MKSKAQKFTSQNAWLYYIFGGSVLVYFWLTKEFIIWTLNYGDTDSTIQLYMYTIGVIWLLSVFFNWIELKKFLNTWWPGVLLAIFPLLIIPLVLLVLFGLHLVEIWLQ